VQVVNGILIVIVESDEAADAYLVPLWEL
jgi:hypothetical protein